MQQKSSKKSIIIVVVIIILALIAYFYFSGTPSDSSSSTLDMQSPESKDAEVAGARVLSLLNQINSLKIDTAIFNDPTYKSLVDYSVEIPEQNVGRPNPFAPLSGTVLSVPKKTN